MGRDGPDGRIVRQHEVAAPRHPPGELFFHALTDYPFRTQGALIHRRCFERVGLFDEKYVRGQDYEFVLRMLRHCRGARVDRPAFVWRVHEGPRGPMSGRHDGKDRKRVWMDFAGLLGHQLRTELRLGEYLLPRVDGPPSSPAAVRSALIHRMSVMASKGLLQEMLEDLREAGRVRVPVDQAPLGRTESLAAWSCATHEYFIIRFLDNPKTFIRHATSLAANSVSRVLIAWLGRGLMYSALRSGTSLKDKSQLVAGGVRLLLAAGTWPRKRTFQGTACP